MNCRFCGTALPEGAVFCGECGKAVPVAATTSPTPRKRATMPPVVAFSSEPDAEPRPAVVIPESGFNCPQCGEIIAPDDVFCGECGFVLSSSSSAPADSRDTAVLDPLPDDYYPGLALVDEALESDAAAESEAPDPELLQNEIQDAGVTEEVELTEIVGTATVADADASAVEPEPIAEADAEPDTAPEAEPESAADPEAEVAPDSIPDADAVVVDPVVSFFAPTRKAMPRVVIEAPREPEAEPIPLVEPLPFREPVVEVVAEPEVEPAAGGTPKVLRKVPDPFPWGKGPSTGAIDLEATRAVASGSAEERFVLQFSTGESVTVAGAGLVGRNPSSQPGEFVDQLVTIFDAGKSVSKTHLEFGQDSGRFWVSDRYSTNGSTVRQPDAEPKRCDPGRRYFIARGTRVDIGEQFFVVS